MTELFAGFVVIIAAIAIIVGATYLAERKDRHAARLKRIDEKLNGARIALPKY